MNAFTPINSTILHRLIAVFLLTLLDWFAAAAGAQTQTNASVTNTPMPAVEAPAEQTNAVPSLSEPELTLRYLQTQSGRYSAALKKARSWLDQLVVDPFVLREHGVKGKKKLTELFDAYRKLLAIAPQGEQSAIKTRISKIAAITAEPRFHDMPTLNETTFKEDATSYLRIAFLLDKMGILPPLYRNEIKKAHPRLNDHMRTRGPNQQMAFHLYYQHFKLEEPFPLATAFEGGVIAARRPLSWFERRIPVYDLTHEIFVPYEFGENLDSNFFSADDKAYLRKILADVSRFYIGMQDPDVVGELASCMNYLKQTDMKEYRDALEYLLNAQRENGMWGEYEWLRGRFGNYVDQAFYLHTTMVVLDALIMAFEPFAKPAQKAQPGSNVDTMPTNTSMETTTRNAN